MPKDTSRLLPRLFPFTRGSQSPYQFNIRSLLTFTAKCGCLLGLMTVSDDTLGAAVALPVFGLWMPFELYVSQVREPGVPTAVSGLFLVARMLFVYAACMIALASTLIACSLTWARPWSLGQAIAVVFGVAILFGWAAICSTTSCVLAAVSWRWDRRARWVVYFTSCYLGIVAAAMGVASLL